MFASASPRYTQQLHDEGLVEKPRIFAFNRMVIVVPAGNTAGLGSLHDLAREGTRVAIATEGVPAGDYARRLIEALDEADVLENVVSEEQDVRGVLGKVILGEVDAGFVYATDANAAEGDVEVIELPEGVPNLTTYEVAVVSGTDDEAGARAFVDLVTSDYARRILRAAGFGLLPE